MSSPLSKPPLPATSEDDFRQWELADRKRLAVPMFLMAGALTLALSVLDTTYFGGSGLALMAVSVRVALAALAVLVALQVRKTTRPGVADAWIFGWSMAIVSALVVRHVLAAHQDPSHHILDVAMAGLWLLLPNPMKLQVIPAFLTAGSALLTPWGDGQPAYVLGGYGFSLAGGLIVAWERARTARLRFRALTEIRTLRGIVPICSSCKQIRDDGGYWRQVEDYVREHTEAEFTHGVCPACAEKLYGAEFDHE